MTLGADAQAQIITLLVKRLADACDRIDLVAFADNVVVPKEPSWRGRPLADGESEIGIAHAKTDQLWAGFLADALRHLGFTICMDIELVHKSRAFVVVFSEDLSRDPIAVRAVTNAAERFNEGNTILINVLHPGVSSELLDKIPDNLAYSLSNTVSISLDNSLQPFEVSLAALVDTIRVYVRQDEEIDISGPWHFHALVQGDGGSSKEMVKEFAAIIVQTHKHLSLKMPNGQVGEGEIDGEFVNLRFNFVGDWMHNPEGWEIKRTAMVGKMRLRILNEGNRLEGWYCDNMTETGLHSGPVSGVKEIRGLSGVWKMQVEGQKEEEIIIIHHGGLSLSIDWSNCYGNMSCGTLVGKIISLHGDWGYFGYSMHLMVESKLNKNKQVQYHMSGEMYCHMLNYTTQTTPVNITNITSEYFQLRRQSIDTPMKHKLISNPKVKVPRMEVIQKYLSYVSPLDKNELAVIILFSKEDAKPAIKLRLSLQAAGIEQIGMRTNEPDLTKTARHCVVLLSEHARRDPALIELVAWYSVRNVPIYNIGLRSWFEIFGGEGWDPAQKAKLSAALAGFNQTGEETLDPTAKTFHHMVKKMFLNLKRFDSWTVTGIWYFTPRSIEDYIDDTDEWTKMTIYVSDDDETETKLLTGFAPNGSRWTGTINKTTRHIEMQTTKFLIEHQSFHGILDLSTYEFAGTMNRGKGRLGYEVTGYIAINGCSGMYSAGSRVFNIVQVTGSRGIVQIFNEFRGCVINSNNEILMSMPVNVTDESQGEISYILSISRSRDGLVLSGCAFTSTGQFYEKVEFKRQAWVMDMPYLVVRQNLPCPHPEVLELAEKGFRAAENQDKSTFQKMLNSKGTEEYDLAVQNYKTYGSVTKIVYLGHAPALGDSTGYERYEFMVHRKKSSSPLYYGALIKRDESKLVYLGDRDDEAFFLRQSPYDIMLSYRSSTAGFIDVLERYLSNEGFLVWRDRIMDTGTNWSFEITKAVRTCGTVIACLSEPYIASPLCTKEIRMGKDAGRSIIPLVLPHTENFVRQPYRGKTVPPTVAGELGECTMIDLRSSTGQLPDPSSVEMLVAAHGAELESLSHQILNLKLRNTTWDMTGEWRFEMSELYTINQPPDVFTADASIVQAGGNISGVLRLPKYEIEMEISNLGSVQRASYVRLVVTKTLPRGTLILILRLYLDSDGMGISGVYVMPGVFGTDEPLQSRGGVVGRRATPMKDARLLNMTELLTAMAAEKAADMGPDDEDLEKMTESVLAQMGLDSSDEMKETVVDILKSKLEGDDGAAGDEKEGGENNDYDQEETGISQEPLDEEGNNEDDDKNNEDEEEEEDDEDDNNDGEVPGSQDLNQDAPDDIDENSTGDNLSADLQPGANEEMIIENTAQVITALEESIEDAIGGVFKDTLPQFDSFSAKFNEGSSEGEGNAAKQQPQGEELSYAPLVGKLPENSNKTQDTCAIIHNTNRGSSQECLKLDGKDGTNAPDVIIANVTTTVSGATVKSNQSKSLLGSKRSMNRSGKIYPEGQGDRGDACCKVS